MPLEPVKEAIARARNGRVEIPRRSSGFISGAAFTLDAPATIEAVWGKDSDVLWPEGEPALLYAPDGVGKTTVAQQLVCRMIGIGPPELFGFPVKPADKVLYLALDRPRQAARSMRRMVSEQHCQKLEERLTVWQGSPPIDVVANPGSLAALAQECGAQRIVTDSLKDLAPKLSDEDTGAAMHRAWQQCVEQGIDVLTLHHPRKAQGDNKRPKTLADVYGSRWFTASCGSVILLWGEAGDPVVQLEHLKQPGDIVGPLTLLHDNHAGTTIVIDGVDVVERVRAAGGDTTPREFASSLFRTADPDRNAIEKARRKLDAAVRDGGLTAAPERPRNPPATGSQRGFTVRFTGVHGGSR